MTKEEQIHITLKSLSESLKLSPENFKLEDPEIAPPNGSYGGPTIVWQFKVKTRENEYITDPLNATRTIIVTYNKIAKQLSCYIFFREVNSITHAIMADSQVTFQCLEIPYFNRTYRQFMAIRKQLIVRHREKEFLNYMKKLNDIFPATHEDELFK